MSFFFLLASLSFGSCGLAALAGLLLGFVVPSSCAAAAAYVLGLLSVDA